MGCKVWYRGYVIEHDPKPIPSRAHDWDWQHDDYDGAPDSRDRRCGSSSSLGEALRAVDEMIADLAEDSSS